MLVLFRERVDEFLGEAHLVLDDLLALFDLNLDVLKS